MRYRVDTIKVPWWWGRGRTERKLEAARDLMRKALREEAERGYDFAIQALVNDLARGGIRVTVEDVPDSRSPVRRRPFVLSVQQGA